VITSPHYVAPILTSAERQEIFQNRIFYLFLLMPVVVSCLRQVYFFTIIPGFDALFSYGYYGSLFVVGAHAILLSKFRLHGRTAFFILACLPGTFLSFFPEEALKRYLGLVILVAAVGPLFPSSKYVRLRLVGWVIVLIFSVFVSVLSIFWYFLPLPSIGIGLFSGATTQPKTLAFNSVLAVIVLASFITTKNWKIALPALVVVIFVTILTGSRASLVVVLVSLSVILYIRRAVGIGVLISGFSAITVLLFSGDLGGILGGETVAWHVDKGLSDTRSHLWDLRLRDYSSSPIFGVGVGVASEILHAPTLEDMASGMAFFDQNGRLVFEPGSSWLAILSMTGLFGSLAFFLLLSCVVRSCFLFWKQAGRQIYALQMATLIFFTLHFIEGGFVLSFGNPHTLYFWLWVGVTLEGRYRFARS
jgi:hypothetical protein